MQVRGSMLGDSGHLRTMRLLPFSAAVEQACLALKRQVTLSLPSRARRPMRITGAYLPRTTVVKLPQAQFLVKLPVEVSVVTKANCDRSSLASIWMQVEVKQESDMIASACQHRAINSYNRLKGP